MILTEIGKFVGAKVAGAIILVAVVAGGVWAWQHPEAVKAFGHVVKATFIWIVIAAALPWSCYLFMRPLLDWQAKLQTARGAATVSVGMIGVYCLVDVLLALWLADWSISGAFTWTVVLLGFLAAGAYNFVICESLARHADS